MLSRRMWLAMLLALSIHLGLLLWAYLTPVPPPPTRRRIIQMDVVHRPPPPPLTPPAPVPVVQPPPQPPRQQPAEPHQKPLPSRPLPEPVPRPTPTPPSEDSPAIVVPAQPKDHSGPKGPINLFPGSLSGITDEKSGPAGGSGTARPNHLIKDERLEVKKEPDFVLTREKDGSYKADTSHFIAHISPEGILTFDDRGPIGFNKGGTFSFDLTDLAMRSHKQDPYGAEKRRFVEFSQKLRDDLHGKHSPAVSEKVLNALAVDLDEIWQAQRPAAVRRREIYERWVDAADDKESGNSSGQKARRLIESFIRRHMPLNTPAAYTPEELHRFASAREGLPPFDPYHGLTKDPE